MAEARVGNVRVRSMGLVSRTLPSGRTEKVYVSVIKTALPCESCEETEHSVYVETLLSVARACPQGSDAAHRKDLEAALKALRAHLDGVVR